MVVKPIKPNACYQAPSRNFNVQLCTSSVVVIVRVVFVLPVFFQSYFSRLPISQYTPHHNSCNSTPAHLVLVALACIMGEPAGA